MAEERAKRLEIKKQIAEGINPAAKRKIDKITGPLTNVNSFKAVSEEWLDKARREGRADRDVSADLRGALIVPKVTHRAAITTGKEAGVLLRAIDAYSGYPVTHAALRLAPYVFVRPGELRQAEWSEFDFTRNIWAIAADKTKMRVAHRVPLSQTNAVAARSIASFSSSSY